MRELLKAAGVDTVNELRYRNPANLAKKMAEANAQLKLVRVLPSEPMIQQLDRTGEEAAADDFLLIATDLRQG